MISTLLVLWLCIPLSVWIKPNGNVAPINESTIIGRPVGCTISFRSRFIHFEIIGLNKPYRLGLCNKAFSNYIWYFFASCQNSNQQSLEKKIIVSSASKFNYSIIGSSEKPTLAFSGSLISSVSLNKILEEKEFDFARIECDELNEFKAYAYLKVKGEKRSE